ncbi:MAG: hypothetical protein GX998_08390 [Firmicutes bacterium]|nr:hypothetical protein [Bacillota bacterium]
MDLVDQFRQCLVEDGKSPATIVSYVGDIRGFLRKNISLLKHFHMEEVCVQDVCRNYFSCDASNNKK